MIPNKFKKIQKMQNQKILLDAPLPTERYGCPVPPVPAVPTFCTLDIIQKMKTPKLTRTLVKIKVGDVSIKELQVNMNWNVRIHFSR